MSYFWIPFSLLYAATILQSSAVNGDSGLSLKCNDTVEVVAGENVTLKCRIIDKTGNNCTGQTYQWSNSDGYIQCNSSLMKYICGWDDVMSVYLTISNVTKEENYTVLIHTDCGFTKSSAIKVVHLHPEILRDEHPKPPPSHSHVIDAVLGISVTLAVVGILYFLFGTSKGKKNHHLCEKKTTPGGDDSEPGKENFLTP